MFLWASSRNRLGKWGKIRFQVEYRMSGAKLVQWSKSLVKVTQSCPTLCNPMNHTVHGILQARILEWVAFPVSRGSSRPRDRIQGSHPGLPPLQGLYSGFWASQGMLSKRRPQGTCLPLFLLVRQAFNSSFWRLTSTGEGNEVGESFSSSYHNLKIKLFS